ncbi:MAG: S8 family serine peptidase [Candidatus Heimdallarchaeota archaeon]|nr:S8 family serine peptidase [Candidatus Heimdallarchaeota archaeon]MCG3257505.1 S8 family serine peptidase [Candidatus Heimdallarchaeota archaeon]MCK4612558.1 S8 family serine peptidase [Candidatus Heimdallarchaeota archaeon]
MRNKPFIIFLVSFLILPLPMLFQTDASLTGYQMNPSTVLNSSTSSDETSFSIIKASNILEDQRWKFPMEQNQIYKDLMKFDGRAMISFFSFDERDMFIENTMKSGTLIERTFKSIPAVSIIYTEETLQQLGFNNLRVKYVYPIGTYDFQIPQNVDMDISGLMDLSVLRQALEIDAIHEAGVTGYGVRIALLDSGLNASVAPALNSLRNYDEPKIVIDLNLIPAFEDSDDLSGHGTHIASVLAGNGKYRNEDGTIELTDDYGIAPDAQLINIKVLDKTGYGKDEWLIIGFDEAIQQNPDLISASLTSVTFAEMGDPIEELIYEAAELDIPVIASAGNYGPSGASIGAPAIWDHVISVGASEYMDNLAIFTSKGLNRNFSVGIDILAPGIAIQGSDASTGGSRWVSGTSVAAPIVSGVFALLIDAFPGLGVHKYEAAILETADDMNFPIIYQGNGMVNPLAAYYYLDSYETLGLFTILPKRISPVNEYFYSCVEGETSEFIIKLISSFDGQISTTLTGDSQFIELSNQIDVSIGWNHFAFNISIPLNTPIRTITAGILFENTDGIIITMSISIQTRYLGGTVLFDNSHENDTENRWFDASSSVGTHNYLTRILKDRGFRIRNHYQGNYSFTNIDILVISDPEFNFTSEELDDIQDFVTSGGSLLFLIDSIRFIDAKSIDNEPLISSNYYACDELLEQFNMSVGQSIPITYVPYEAQIIETENFDVDSFMFWGRPVFFSDNPNENNTVIATFETVIDSEKYTFNAAIAKEYHNGRVMVFGSGYPFTDHGLLPDSYESNPSRAGLDYSFKDIFGLDDKNSQLVNETFNWLIDTHRPEYIIKSTPEETFIRKPVSVGVQIRFKNGSFYVSGNNKLNATLMYPNLVFENLELVYNSTSSQYEITFTLEEYGLNILYIPLKFTDYTPSDGRFEILNNVQFWDQLSTIRSITNWVIAILFVSLAMVPVIRFRFRKITT